MGNNYKLNITNATGTEADAEVTFTFEVESVIKCQPFQYNSLNPQPFKDVNTFKMLLSMDDLTSDFIAVDESISDGDPLDIEFTNLIWELRVHAFNPGLQLAMPKEIVYSCPQVIEQVTKGFTVSAGTATTELEAGSFIFDSVPTAIFIYAKVDRPADAKYNVPDSFLAINKVSINVANESKRLYDLDQSQLYDLSVKNGYNQRYSTFTSQLLYSTADANVYGAGSILCLKPEDIAVAQSSGFVSHSPLSFTCNLQVTVDEPPTDKTVTLKVLSLYDDLVLQDMTGKYTSQRPFVNLDDIVKAPVQFVDNQEHLNKVMGGSFWGNLWNNILSFGKSPLAKNISKFARNNVPIVSDYTRDGTFLGDTANRLGYGNKSAPKRGKAKAKGGELVRVGGKKYTRAQMNKMLKK
jgi:hypothetical protein